MKKKIKEIGKYGVVGALNTAISLICYTVLILIGVGYITANILAYFAGVINGYIWNKKWVFQVNNKSHITKLKYFVTGLFGLGMSSLLLILFVEKFKIDEIVSQFFITGIIIVTNYIINKKWVFKKG